MLMKLKKGMHELKEPVGLESESNQGFLKRNERLICVKGGYARFGNVKLGGMSNLTISMSP